MSACQTRKYSDMDFLDFLRPGENDVRAFAESRQNRPGCVPITSRRDMMRDPRYPGILQAIGNQLHATDRLAAARGLALTDSNIRPLRIRAINEAKRKASKADASACPEKDRLLVEAQRELAAPRAGTVEERDLPDGSAGRRPLPADDWIAALEAIKESCAVRQDVSRGRTPSWSSCANS